MNSKKITEELMELCAKNGVKCLYAVESGSRAWGFASPDSDYDIRFIYVRPQIDYLRIDRPRDVIEYMGKDDLDFVGWDATKAIKLIAKSNPSIIEWLNTKDVYYKIESAYRLLQNLSKDYFSSYRLAMHYISLAKSHDVKYIENHEMVAPKKSLYALRALLSVRYVLKHNKPAPVLFADLLPVSGLERALNSAITDLLNIKSQTNEKQSIARVKILDNFIARELDTLGTISQSKDIGDYKQNDALDKAFTELISM